MIEFLTNWLKEIIIVVLLAVFLDLLLPNTSMQRYVKMVMGLFILMTMLSPVLRLLNDDFDFSKMELWTTTAQSAETEKVADYTQKLKEWQQQQSQKYVESQIASLVKQDIESTYPVDVIEVNVTTALPSENRDSEGNDNLPKIAALQILVKEREDSSTSQSSGAVGVIKPIEPVVIDPVTIGDRPEREQEIQDTERQKLSDQNQTLLRNIEQGVQTKWLLKPGQVKAYWMNREGGEIHESG
ncbi:MAG: stage III sporulation protein AF [Bacillaceae bacterium]|nr:stage III sporulation protein AF [Bacillaceae bacterium]